MQFISTPSRGLFAKPRKSCKCLLVGLAWIGTYITLIKLLTILIKPKVQPVSEISHVWRMPRLEHMGGNNTAVTSGV